jgi:DNA-binding CsgD family transcriptional regulator
MSNLPLTKTQFKVALLVALGYKREYIGSLLGHKTQRTVDKHLQEVFLRLGVSSNLELVHWAIYNHFISPLPVASPPPAVPNPIFRFIHPYEQVKRQSYQRANHPI